MKANELQKSLEETTKPKVVSVVENMDNEKMAEVEKTLQDGEDNTPFVDPALQVIKEIVNILRDTEEIDTITDFKRPQVILFEQVELLGTHFKLPSLTGFCLGIKKKNISIDRGSRTELLRAIERIQPTPPEMSMGEHEGFPLSYGKNMKG